MSQQYVLQQQRKPKTVWQVLWELIVGAIVYIVEYVIDWAAGGIKREVRRWAYNATVDNQYQY